MVYSISLFQDKNQLKIFSRLFSLLPGCIETDPYLFDYFIPLSIPRLATFSRCYQKLRNMWSSSKIMCQFEGFNAQDATSK